MYRFLTQYPLRQTSIWLIRLAILSLVVTTAAEPRPYVIVGEPQAVETQHPIVCTHTRLTDEVDEWKVQRTLQLVREMGAPTIVEFFPWAYIESSKGRYDWEHSDQIMRHARAQGLTVIARLGLVPEWVYPVKPGDDPQNRHTLNYLTPDHFQDFANFVETFAAHYRGQISLIVIWNEPNLSFEWGYQSIDPQIYVDVLKVAYPAAKRGNPDVIVLAAGPAPTLEPIGSPFGMNDLDYARKLYELGAKPYFDGIAAHSYGLKFPPDDPPSPEVLNFRRVELLRQIMVDNGDSKKSIYITEFGWNDHPRWTKAVRPGQRIAYTIGAFKYAEANWGWAKSLCIWAFRYPSAAQSFPDYYTLVTPDFTAKPIYYEIQAWARGN